MLRHRSFKSFLMQLWTRFSYMANAMAGSWLLGDERNQGINSPATDFVLTEFSGPQYPKGEVLRHLIKRGAMQSQNGAMMQLIDQRQILE